MEVICNLQSRFLKITNKINQWRSNRGKGSTINNSYLLVLCCYYITYYSAIVLLSGIINSIISIEISLSPTERTVLIMSHKRTKGLSENENQQRQSDLLNLLTKLVRDREFPKYFWEKKEIQALLNNFIRVHWFKKIIILFLKTQKIHRWGMIIVIENPWTMKILLLKRSKIVLAAYLKL